MIGYLCMFLALVLSSMTGVLFKAGAGRKGELVLVAVFYFLLASSILLIYHLFFGGFRINLTSVAIGLMGGVTIFGTIMSILRGLQSSRASVFLTVVGLSLIVPVIVSIVFWGEKMNGYRFLGFVCVCMSIVLLGRSK